jgi:ribosomal protein L20A (L18A)
MPRFKVYGAVDYCRPMEGYIEVEVEATDQEAAIEAALVRTFGPVQRARYNIVGALEVTEVDEAIQATLTEEN